MTSDDRDNPFAPPLASEVQADPPSSAHPFTGMRYTEAYTFMFDKPSWGMNLLMVTLCQFIPYIGMMLVIGYQFQIVEALHRRPKQVYPDFDFNRFVEYLVRGLWVFLELLVVGVFVGVVAMGVMAVLGFVVYLVAAAASGGNGAQMAGIVVMPLFFVLFLPLQLAMMVVIVPCTIRAGLARGFNDLFDLAFVTDFIKRTWWETLLAALFMAVTSMGVVLIGLLVFCIGALFAAAIVQIAYAHIYYQLYQLYLSRGGRPLPLREPAA